MEPTASPRRTLAVCVALAALVACVAPAAAVPGVSDVPEYQGAPARPKPIRARPVPHNPYLAANGRSNMHDDSYASDAYRRGGPLGRRVTVRSTTYGIEECATMTFDRAGRIEALCVGAEGPRLMLLDPRTLDVIAAHPLPPRTLKPGTSPLQDLCGGAYFYLDNRDRAVVETTNHEIWVISQAATPAGPALRLDRRYDVSAAVPDGDCLIALMPDWHGLVWFVTERGGVGTLDRRTGRVRSIRLPGERILNSFATDETGGVFVASDHAMYRFDSGRRGRPVVTWRQRYDRGSRQKPGQLSQGSGTTPTLIGRDLVVITDNADPRIHVVAYKRTAAPRAHRRVCREAVFRHGRSATENSLVAVGRSVVAENNYGYTGPESTMQGGSVAPGVARVRIGRHGCSTMWTSHERAPTSVAKASLGNGLLYAYTKPAGVQSDPWYLTAIDLRSGRTAYRRLAGTGQMWNNHYAAIYLRPHGRAYLATLGGMLRFQDARPRR